MSLCGSSIEQGKTQNFRVIKEQSLCKIAKKSHFMPKRNYHSTKVSGNLESISTETHTGRCAIKNAHSRKACEAAMLRLQLPAMISCTE